MNEKISEFKLSYTWLSNFYPCEIEVDEIYYPSLEHAYQAAKTEDILVKREIAALSTPGKAKRFGQALTLTPDWNGRKVDVMEKLLRIKFNMRCFKVLLIRTHPMILEEGNHWKDEFWGVCPSNSDIGENHLGKLLMKLRDELRARGKLL